MYAQPYMENPQQPHSNQLKPYDNFLSAIMPPGTPHESRYLREAREAIEALEARFARAYLENRSLEAQRALSAHEPQLARSSLVRAAEPELALNRATTLLACICLLRIHCPHWGSHDIALQLHDSFPDIAMQARDIEPLFRATCRNRPGWVRAMRQVDDPLQQAIARDMLELLHTTVLAHLPQLPQEHHQDPRDAIRYLRALVGVGEGDGPEMEMWGGSRSG